jgi:hypothetical protein
MFSGFRLTVVHLSKRNICDLARNVLWIPIHRCPLLGIIYKTQREMFSSYGLTVVHLSKRNICDPARMFSLTAVRVPAGEGPLHLGNTNHLAKLAKVYNNSS